LFFRLLLPPALVAVNRDGCRARPATAPQTALSSDFIAAFPACKVGFTVTAIMGQSESNNYVGLREMERRAAGTGSLDDCDLCEPTLEREIELDLERKALENTLLRKRIDPLEKSQEYRCCPEGAEEDNGDED